MAKNNEYPWRLSEWFPEISHEQLIQLKLMQVELIHFNGIINLISPRTEQDADIIHFADSILACKAIVQYTKFDEIYDIGSGNGLPGLVLAVLYPEIRVVLVDVDARKIEFIKYTAFKMGLTNVQVTHKRLQDLNPKSISCGVSRGFASISKALLQARKVFLLEGEYFHFKSSNWVTEVAEIPTQICAYWAPILVEEYELPVVNREYSVVLTKKIG